jgi:hypothetical protein
VQPVSQIIPTATNIYFVNRVMILFIDGTMIGIIQWELSPLTKNAFPNLAFKYLY